MISELVTFFSGFSIGAMGALAGLILLERQKQKLSQQLEELVAEEANKQMKQVRLLVYTRSNVTIDLSTQNWNGNNLGAPWKPFLKWYHGRPQSESFTFHYQGGLRMVTRDQILGFQIKEV